MGKHASKILILSILVILISALLTTASLYLFKTYCQQTILARSEFGKLPIIDRSRVSEGLTLFTNLNSSNIPFKQGTVYLVDNYGKVVHKWITKGKTQYSILKADGNLLVTQGNFTDKNFPQAARITSIQELDPESNVIWEYKNSGLHHDFESLPNGNIAVLEWVKVPEEMIRQINGGVGGTEFEKKDIFTDRILEVDRDKNIVWSWNAAEHISPDEYEIPPFFSREQWTHANSIRYVSSDPFLQKEAYLVSMRYLNQVFLISKESGDVIWKSPKGLLMHQHDATLLANGNILVFNNGFHTSLSQNPFSYGSSVVEINPKTNEVVWEFPGSKNPLDRSKLTEVILSGAQRLPNGNTMITLGTSGRMIEVTPGKEIVWDMINPYSDQTDQPFPSNYIFKARKYFKQDVDWLNSFNDSGSRLVEYCQ